MDSTQSYCLVLGGGGAKGVYHIGVWQALQELDVPVNAFIGNSIGAVISAFLAQGAEEALLETARSININSLIRLPEDSAQTDEKSLSKHTLKYWQSAYESIVDKRGLDTGPMRELLEGALDEETIRGSGHDFGITTVNVSDFEPREVFIEDMESGELINYVMASAAFPGFERPKIDGKSYVDGGLYSNVPYAMARKRGYRRIILVDISGLGLNRRPKTEGSQTIYIKNSIDMGSAFEFDPEFIREFWLLGYLDTMRTFDRLVGYRYFITPNENMERYWREKYSGLLKQRKLLSVFPEEMKHDRRELLKIMEVCADLLRIPRIKSYSYDEMRQAINVAIANTEAKADEFIRERDLNPDAPSSKLMDALARDVLQMKSFSENPYYYHYLSSKFPESRTAAIAAKYLTKTIPELKVLKLYLDEVRSQELLSSI